MKPTEAAALLTIAAAYDNRRPDADQAKAWAMALDGLRFEDCRTVIVEHYRRSREWLMPVDVCGGVKRLRAQRIDDFGPIPAPKGIDPDDTEAYTQARLAIQTAIADGTYASEPEPVLEEIQARDVVKELGHIGQSVDEGLKAAPLRAELDRVRREQQEADAQRKRAEDERRAEVDAARAALRVRQVVTETSEAVTTQYAEQQEEIR